MRFLLLAFVGFLVGTFVVALGSGGGSVYVAVLSSLFGLDPSAATTSSLVAAAPSVAIGTWQYRRTNAIDYRKANRMLLATVPWAVAFSLGSFLIPKKAYSWILAAILVIVGAVIVVKAFRGDKEKEKKRPEDKKPKHAFWIYFVSGLLGGIMVGIGGMSGGEPVLAGLLLLGDNAFETIASSSWVVFWTGLLGIGAHILGGGAQWDVVLPLVLGDSVGAFFAPRVARFMTHGGRQKWLMSALGVLLIAMSVKTAL
ncbi:MAG: sulfite exporter TauE/SafE family protein [Aeriscardovia sp.]|nr:sulfite exporter TauE/SafE family protein [Aeriscardovia sp.]